MSRASALLRVLQDGTDGNKRIAIDQIWRAFHAAVPGYSGNAEARPRLADLLRELAETDAIGLPRTRKPWDRSAEPPLPRWIDLGGEATPSSDQRDHRRIAWPAPMLFVSELPRVSNLDELLAIRRFFAEGGEHRPKVPVRERSLELFGNEKRLDRVCKSGLFGPGRLSLELLRCREVAPPLVFEAVSESFSASVLILENLHSYDSFRRYNRRAKTYRAIAYGHGSEFHATVGDLPRLCADLELDTIEYFGDLDSRGLSIAQATDRWLSQRGLRLLPSVRWYRELLELAEERKLRGPSVALSVDELSWLPPDVAERTRTLLTAGHRGPQELVGWELLEALIKKA